MTKKLILTMGILGILFGCKSKANTADPQNGNDITLNTQQKMPEGRLLRVQYFYQGMMMEEFGSFDLQRTSDGCKLSFRHFSSEVSYEVSDTLLDAARRIIEQEKMYEYASSYSLQMDDRILDGYSWSFDADFEGDEHISSGGRHVSPQGDGLYKISTLLSNAARQLVKAENK